MAAPFNINATACGNVTTGGTTVFSCVAPSTDVYSVQCWLQLPTLITSGANSSIVTTVKDGASTIYTSNAGDRSLNTTVSATAGDTISIILSSAVLSDQANNACQITIAISEGDSIN